MTPVRGRALVGALALTAASTIGTLRGASPAAAYVCSFGIDSPASGSISGSAAVRFTGPFTTRHGSADRALEVTFTRSPGATPAATARTGGAVGPEGRYDVTVGPLSRNGRYTARVRASHAGTSLANCDDGIGSGARDTERTAEVSFAVSVRASPPVNVAARLDGGPRTALLSWDRSGDPDIAGYTISRRVGSDAPTVVQVPPDPLGWTDPRLPEGAATLTYSIAASRQGPDPGTTSEPSPPVTVTLDVPAPPPPSATPTTTPGPGAKAGPGAAATSPPKTAPFVLGRAVGGTASAPLPLPGLLTDLGPPSASAPGAVPDDGTYRPLLPYDPDATRDGAPAGVGADPAVVGDGERDHGGDGPPQLAYVASGLLSGVVAAHVLWLRKQALRPAPGEGRETPPLEAVEPAAAVSPPAGPAAASKGDAPVTKPRAPLGSGQPVVILVPPRSEPA